MDDIQECEEGTEDKYMTNVKRVQALRALRMSLFGIPVVVEYLQEKGLALADVFQVKSVHSLMVVLLEVPSGYVSDRFGRRPAIIMSCICGVFYWLAMGAGQTKRHFQGAQILLGVSDSLFSGTDAAVLYESLDKSGNAGKALEGESHAVFISQASETIASIIGGYVASKLSLRATMWLTCIPYLIATIISSRLIETSGFKEQAHRPAGALGSMMINAQHLWSVIRSDLLNRRLGPELLAGILLGSATYTAVWITQPLWKRAGLPLEAFGWAWATLNAAVALTALTAPLLKQLFGVRKALVVLGVWGFLWYSLLGTLRNSLLLVLAGCALNWVRGGGAPIVTTAINLRASPTHRASLLSVRSMLTQSVFFIYAPIIGYVSNTFGLSVACFTTGATLSLGAAGALSTFMLLYPVLDESEGKATLEEQRPLVQLS